MELPIVDPAAVEGAVVPGRFTEYGGQQPAKGNPFRHVELEITTACDLDCFGCDRFSDVTNAPNMTLNQVRRFVGESLGLNWQWDRIRLLGGEPTLHPHFRDIVEEAMFYRHSHPKCFIQVLSNGHGKLAQYRSWLIEHGIDPHEERKQRGVTPQWFHNTRIAPVDRWPEVGELPPCGIFGAYGCGIGLTRHGYFLDGAGASVARVAGLDVGVMKLKDVTWERMLEQARVICRLCGHWNSMHGPQSTKLVSETGKVTGDFWTEKIEAYRKQKPVLRVYGE